MYGVITASCDQSAVPKSQMATVLRSFEMRMLSSLISPCSTLHFCMWCNPMNIWRAYILIPVRVMPTSRPYVLRSLRKFMSMGWNTKHRWPLYSKCDSSLQMCFLPSGSSLPNLESTSISFFPAVCIVSLDRCSVPRTSCVIRQSTSGKASPCVWSQYAHRTSY